jgi:hypothetical protein
VTIFPHELATLNPRNNLGICSKFPIKYLMANHDQPVTLKLKNHIIHPIFNRYEHLLTSITPWLKIGIRPGTICSVLVAVSMAATFVGPQVRTR